MMKRLSRLAVVPVIVLGMLAPALVRGDGPATKPVEAKVGDTSLTIPAPSGFVDIHQGPSEILDMLSKFIPPEAGLAAGFIEPSAAQAKEAPDHLEKYMIVAYMHQFENQVLSDDDWAEAKKSVVNADMGEARDYAAKNLDKLAPGQLDVGKPVSLGKVVDEPNAVGIGTLTKYSMANPDGTKQEVTMVGGYALVKVKGKVIFLYVFCPYKDKDSVDWMVKTTQAWTDDVLKANR